MLFTIFASVLAFAATAFATPAVGIRGLAADAALNALIADSFDGSFPGIVLVSDDAAALGSASSDCRTSSDCPHCLKCTYCLNWRPGCCRRISPRCAFAEANALLAADPQAKPLCSYCSSKTCFQIECQPSDAPGDIVKDAAKIPITNSKPAETAYSLNLVVDGPVAKVDECQPKDLACASGVCWVQAC